MFLAYLALLIIFIYLLDQLLFDKRNLELVKQFNGPLRLPIIGTFYILFGVTTKSYYDFVKNSMEKYGRNKTKVVYSWNSYILEIKIDDYKLIERITTDQKFLAKSSQYSFMANAIGEGLIFSSGKKWFQRRRIITPTFYFKILEQFFDIFKKHNEVLVEKLKEQNEKEVNIIPIVASSILRSLCETALGHEVKGEDTAYLNAIKNIGQLIGTRFLTPWQKFDFLFNMSHLKKVQDKLVATMRTFTTEIIEERRKKLVNERNELENLSEEGVGLKKKMCLLDVLLMSNIDGQPLSNEDIEEEVNTFTFAGHESTTSAICFTLYLVSKHPQVQEKLRKEIDSILGTEELTFNQLNEFKYLECVIKETLRLYPPAPIISRRLYEEVDFGDFIAPANANYNLVLYTAFRNPEVFENPDAFIPERFMKEMHPFAFVPFSAGQRNCIGQKFAMTSIKTNIIGILRNFTVTFPGIEPDVEINITMRCNSLLLGLKNTQ